MTPHLLLVLSTTLSQWSNRLLFLILEPQTLYCSKESHCTSHLPITDF